MTAELHHLSATEAIARFRARTLSPVELMEAVIARVEAVDGAVNALPVRFFEAALEAARAAEARYTPGGPEPRPLEGIPIAVKEETAVAGQPWTHGSLVHRDDVATETAVCVERLIAAGGIVHARATSPEYSCTYVTESRLRGVTRNPWDLALSPGGSSGGSAAALAAGMTTLATGSDIAGSIRVPAAFCGVVGFKPPYGRVPESPPYNLDHYCHEGPMARSVADCRLMENVMAGPHPSDIASLRPKLTIPEDPGDVRGLRIAVSLDLGCYEPDAEVAAGTLAAAEAFSEAGAIVEEVDPGWSRQAITEAALAHLGTIDAALIAPVVERHRDEMTGYAAAYASLSRRTPEGAFARSLEIEGELTASLGGLLERHDALLCPTFGVAALEAGRGYTLEQLLPVAMTVPFNIASRCPVMAVPTGRAPGGAPTGVQIVGRAYDDAAVFQLALAFERLRPWLDLPERRPALPVEPR